MTDERNTLSDPAKPEKDHPRQPEKNRRGLRIAAWSLLGTALVALIGVVGIDLYYSARTPPRHPGFSTIGTTDIKPVPVTIGGRHYQIPANYFSAPPRRSGREQQSLLLLAHWPSLEGRTEGNWADLRVGHWGNKVQILLDTSKSKNSAIEIIEIALNSRMKNSAPLNYEGKIFDFDYYIPFGGYSMVGRYEYFVIEKNGAIELFIQCRPDGSVPSPSCTHWFPLTDLIWARVSYGKPLFPRWQEIQAAVIARLRQFESTAQQSSQSIQE
jgi:hypothetical protein